MTNEESEAIEAFRLLGEARSVQVISLSREGNGEWEATVLFESEESDSGEEEVQRTHFSPALALRWALEQVP